MESPISDCSREQRAMALLGLGRQSAIDLALDEWAAVAEAGVIGSAANGNHSAIVRIKTVMTGWFMTYDIVAPFFTHIRCLKSFKS